MYSPKRPEKINGVPFHLPEGRPDPVDAVGKPDQQGGFPVCGDVNSPQQGKEKAQIENQRQIQKRVGGQALAGAAVLDVSLDPDADRRIGRQHALMPDPFDRHVKNVAANLIAAQPDPELAVNTLVAAAAGLGRSFYPGPTVIVPGKNTGPVARPACFLNVLQVGADPVAESIDQALF